MRSLACSMVPRPRAAPPEAREPAHRERVIKRATKVLARGRRVETTWVIKTTGWRRGPRGCWRRCGVWKRQHLCQTGALLRQRELTCWAQRERGAPGRFRMRVCVDRTQEYLSKLAVVHAMLRSTSRDGASNCVNCTRS